MLHGNNGLQTRAWVRGDYAWVMVDLLYVAQLETGCPCWPEYMGAHQEQTRHFRPPMPSPRLEGTVMTA
jgi:hypothetical protein